MTVLALATLVELTKNGNDPTSVMLPKGPRKVQSHVTDIIMLNFANVNMALSCVYIGKV
jgi:hypothetical protein